MLAELRKLSVLLQSVTCLTRKINLNIRLKNISLDSQNEEVYKFSSLGDEKEGTFATYSASKSS